MRHTDMKTEPRPDYYYYPRKGTPYRVPDGYFSDLRSNILSKAAQTNAVTFPKQRGAFSWLQVRGLVGVAASFAVLVLLASVGFYYTAYRAHNREKVYAMAAGEDALLGYTIYSEDIDELLWEEEVLARDPEGAERRFDQAVDEYLALYGSGLLAVADFTY